MPEKPSIPTAISEPTHVIRPTTPKERIQVIDILRGFALFGILLVGMGGVSGPEGADWWTGTADRVAKQLIFYLAQGKFVTMFSFLFGLSFCLQLVRAESRAADFFSLYRRRLLALLLIGLLHVLFLSSWDVLVIYALMGFLLFLFRHAKTETLLALAIVLMLFHYGNWEFDIIRQMVRAPAGEQSQTTQSVAGVQAKATVQVETDLRLYGQGSFSEIMTRRVQVWFDNALEWWIGSYPFKVILALFLLGLWVGRRGVLHDVPAHLAWFRQVRKWALGLALVFTAFSLFLWGTELVPSSWQNLWTPVYFAVGVPSLSFLYVSTLVLLDQNDRWNRWLAFLDPVGRTALSNYLLQSVICTTIFYSYGLGLYGKVGPALGMALTVLIFTLQIMLSGWWLKHFRFGPAEWLWRTLTYGKLQPMRLRRA